MRKSHHTMGEEDPAILRPQVPIRQFRFRDLDPNIFLGTASDRYSGWVGQIYTKARYEGRIGRRTHTVGGQAFVEETLSLESVAEYFDHFSVLEIDYTFYSPLLDKNGDPTQIFHVLNRHREHMKEHDCVVLKVPQFISAQKMRHGDGYVKTTPTSIRRCFADNSMSRLWRSWGLCSTG